MGNLLSEQIASQRRLVEMEIEAEEAAFAEVVDLLGGKVPFAAWPIRLQRALRAALTEQNEPVEAHKARCLCRHLFRSADSAAPVLKSSGLTARERWIAERLRADLPAVLPLGAALGLGGCQSKD